MEKKTKTNNTNQKKVETKKKSTVKNTNTVRKNTKRSKKAKKTKAFTLIELLAVIIILGVLMIIAIPSVTTYISNSRKSSYIDTAKNIVGGTRNLVNEGKLEMYDPTVTYYIPVSCIKTENGSKTPYGDFEEDGAYVGVTFDGNGYNYYWISNDTSGQGINEVTPVNDLNEEKIVSGIKSGEVRNIIQTTGIDGRNSILIYNSDCTGTASGNGTGGIIYPEGKNKSTVVFGDLVKIGTEDFYVIKRDGNDLVLLARYNLKVGNICDGNQNVIGAYSTTEEGYGIQSSDASGYLLGSTVSTYGGTIPFAVESYWDSGIGTTYPGTYCTYDVSTYTSETVCAYVYDSHSNLYQHINSYKRYLENQGATIKKARLIKLEELLELGCNMGTHSCANAPSFISGLSFWTGSVRNDYLLWGVSNSIFGALAGYSNVAVGLRPVIVI